MIDKEMYNIWAPYGVSWTKYARPVAFYKIHEFNSSAYKYLYVPKINYIEKYDKECAYIVDMPGESSIEEGLAIAKFGYRPIPLFNGTIESPNSIPTSDNKALQIPLAWGTTIVKDLQFDKDAAPVFLIDLNRQDRYKMDVSLFDNSYDMYAQDFPTASALLENGINKVIVRTDEFQKDLRIILAKYQKQGIKIYQANDNKKPKKVRIIKPLFYKN